MSHQGNSNTYGIHLGSALYFTATVYFFLHVKTHKDLLQLMMNAHKETESEGEKNNNNPKLETSRGK